MALNEVKSMYEALQNYFTMIENDFEHMDEFGPYPYADIFAGETCNFAYYMAAKDGLLDERERVYINEITGLAESTQSMIDSMRQSGVILSDDRERFVRTPFKSLVIAILADSAYQADGEDSQILKLALSFFGMLGTDLVSVDGLISPSEQASLQSIVTTMERVAQQACAALQQQAAQKETADTGEDVPSEAADDMEENTSSDTPDDTAEDVPSGDPDNAAEETSSEVPDDAAEDVPSEVPDDAAEETSSEVPDDTAEDVPSEVPDDAAEETSSEVPDDAAEDVPSEVPDDAAGETSAEVPASDSVCSPAEDSADTPCNTPPEAVPEPASEDDSPILMSIEDIVAEVNAPEEDTDIIKGLELSIGENGASYIAFHLSPELRALICPELSDKDVPLMLVGNIVCASFDNQIVKKHLLNGTCTTREIAAEVVASMNRCVSPIAEANTAKIEGNEKLSEVIHDMLNISQDSSSVHNLNDLLENRESRLCIVQSNTGEYAVSDAHHFTHSLEEVLWILSF